MALTLEQLKRECMLQAEEKGWGTKQEEIHTAEKVLLIITEGEEIIDSIKENSQTKDRTIEEWGDILQRTLHLGGCHNTIFPEPNINEFININQVPNEESARERLNWINSRAINAYRSYRKKDLTNFSKGLIEIAHYCMAVANVDNFQIDKQILEKIEDNKSKIWSKEKYNERFNK